MSLEDLILGKWGSWTAAARELGTSRGTLRAVARYGQDPSLRLAVALAESLEVSAVRIKDLVADARVTAALAARPATLARAAGDGHWRREDRRP